MLELASKIRRNTDRLAAEEAAPLPPADQVCANARHLSKHCVDAMAVLMQPGMQPGVAGSSPQTQRLRPVLGVGQKLLDDMADELQELLTRSEVLGEQGDVDGSQAAAAQAEAVKVGQGGSKLCMPRWCMRLWTMVVKSHSMRRLKCMSWSSKHHAWPAHMQMLCAWWCSASLWCRTWSLTYCALHTAGAEGESRGGSAERHWRQPVRHAGGVPAERCHHQQGGEPHPRPQERAQLPVRFRTWGSCETTNLTLSIGDILITSCLDSHPQRVSYFVHKLLHMMLHLIQLLLTMSKQVSTGLFNPCCMPWTPSAAAHHCLSSGHGVGR